MASTSPRLLLIVYVCFLLLNWVVNLKHGLVLRILFFRYDVIELWQKLTAFWFVFWLLLIVVPSMLTGLFAFYVIYGVALVSSSLHYYLFSSIVWFYLALIIYVKVIYFFGVQRLMLYWVLKYIPVRYVALYIGDMGSELQTKAIVTVVTASALEGHSVVDRVLSARELYWNAHNKAVVDAEVKFAKLTWFQKWTYPTNIRQTWANENFKAALEADKAVHDFQVGLNIYRGIVDLPAAIGMRMLDSADRFIAAEEGLDKLKRERDEAAITWATGVVTSNAEQLLTGLKEFKQPPF